MKKKEILKNNILLKQIKFSSKRGSKKNCVKIHSTNNIEHERTKFEISYKLIKQGFEVYTEAEFLNKKRADIVAIKNGVGYIIEVINSESNESYRKKLNSYPIDFTMIKINCNNFDYNKFTI